MRKSFILLKIKYIILKLSIVKRNLLKKQKSKIFILYYIAEKS